MLDKSELITLLGKRPTSGTNSKRTELFFLIDSGLIVEESQLFSQIGDSKSILRFGLLLQLSLKSSFTGNYFSQHFCRVLFPPLYIELLIAPILNQTNKLIILFGVAVDPFEQCLVNTFFDHP